jgi:hypothetical protein
MKRTSPHQKQRQVEKKEVKENERAVASPAIQLLFFFLKKLPSASINIFIIFSI